MNKTCPECGGIMRRFLRRTGVFDDPLDITSQSIEMLQCVSCGYSERVKSETDHDHALDACKYTMQNLFDCSKMLAEMPPMGGVDVTLRDFSARLDEKVQKAYIDGCVLVEIDPEALKKTAELNSELQSCLRKAVEKIPRWIPASERLPDKELRAYKEKYPKEECVEVIAVIQGSSESTVLTYDGEYFEDFYGNAYSVSHWMSMPEAPKETERAEVQDAE